MTTTDYRAIDCGLYSQYEVYILHRTRLVVDADTSDGALRSLRCHAVDLQTRDGAEFIALLDEDGKQRWVRLDRLLSVSPAED